MSEDQKPKIKYKVSVMPEEFRFKKKENNINYLIIGLSVFLVIFIGGSIFVINTYRSKRLAANNNQQNTIKETEKKQNIEEKQTTEEKSKKEEKKKEDVAVDDNKKEEVKTEDVVLPPIFSDIFTTSKDTDQDGLTDVEEELFSTSSAKPDTDGDGHLDATEVINLYNPAGVAPANLKNAASIDIYKSDKYSFSIFYPSKWQARALTPDKSKIVFSSDTGEYVQVSVYKKPQDQTILNWYLDKSPGVSDAQIEVVEFKKSGLKGIKTIDGLTFVLFKPISANIIPEGKDIYLYVINYIPGNKVELNFKTTFQMMVNSFRVQEQQVDS